MKLVEKDDPWWWVPVVLFLIIPGAWIIGLFMIARDEYHRRFKKKK